MRTNAAETRNDQDPSRSPTGRVQSLDRAAALLNAISAGAPEGRSAAELAVECGLNRATAWRLLATLEHHSMVERDPATNRYSIGFAIARMATSAGVEGLVRRSHGILERLCGQTGETANLAVPQRLGLTYVDEVIPPVVLSARWLGRQVPIHATSAGKALLAWLPEEEVEAMLAQPLPEYTGTTRTDRAALRAELAEVRANGYAISVGELEPHLYGVAAPVLDDHRRPFAIVSIWGPQDRVPRPRFPELGELAQRAASEIAAAMSTA
ncbi:IclR family transcriptional regulator [Saccharopolyspora erythraea NRRL 2338]|uniref:Repressor of aceBA operon n=2 Tax=Saccharopolyspora erythraea TaxID=1836 RepID=A4FDK2_SACEN|nr:IclR family transcriptional regulator [Saccharopolyspora erythraea]EQD82749.1 IclR family transcriptional regulator [Saccharopolyspora erythraea D]PFG95862.1 IclR family transcriptional regulator [Saccharopolyspora erythraea NRRL 2338]QRK92439.1 IclR family transcriptional regulator [Saccharopolyspora erythraea]CAM02127.1 repressor of aceBA operon [Saccharopolyspora erythraea NRRL 2338]